MAFILHWAIRASAGAGGFALFFLAQAVKNNCSDNRRNNKRYNYCADILNYKFHRASYTVNLSASLYGLAII